MKGMAEEGLIELRSCPNGMFRVEKGVMIDSKEVERGRCMRGSDGKLCISENDRSRAYKDYIERMMSDENVQ